MVAIHLAVVAVVVGTLSATLDKAKLYILSGILIVPIEIITLTLQYKCNKCCREDHRWQFRV